MTINQKSNEVTNDVTDIDISVEELSEDKVFLTDCASTASSASTLGSCVGCIGTVSSVVSCGEEKIV